ncbi:hypothetical protein [Rhodospirillaceae bacterium SYSU D60014]|uniref:hypothetical protein n=1 Tax=Virgifigura deserti TaxID=2268457 RepID=UPI000E66AEC2
MDIYRAETRPDGLEVYRDRSVAGEAPIVGFLGPPAAIRDIVGDFLEWEIYCPNTRAMRIPVGVPFALCHEITPEDMAGTKPFITWAPIEYEELLKVIAGG